MPADTFVANRLRALRAPIAGPNGRAFATAIGSAQDDELPVLRVAGVCRSLSKAPGDALAPVIGSLYQRAEAPRELYTEPLSGAYRARLALAWPFWESAPMSGNQTTTGLSSLLAVYLNPEWTFTRLPIVWSAWQIGPSIPWYSLVFGMTPVLTSDDNWGVGGPTETWGDGGLWGLFYDPTNPYQWDSFGVADLAWIRREFRLCKSAQAYPVVLSVPTAFDATADPFTAVWGDGGTWGDAGGLWGDPPPASVLYLLLGHVWGEEIRYGVGGPGLWGEAGDVWDAYEAPMGGPTW
jgi:hypothetical protein